MVLFLGLNSTTHLIRLPPILNSAAGEKNTTYTLKSTPPSESILLCVFLDNLEVSYGSGSSVIDTLQNMQVSIGDSNVDLYLPTKVGSRWNQMHSSLMVDIYTQLSHARP